MAASVQLQTSAATKPCTSKFGASAARGNAASTRPFVHLPLTDFTKTFLAGALDFHLKSSEQALVGSRIRVKASASAGREQKGAHISRSREVPHGSSHSRSMRTTTSRAVAVGTGDAEHVTVQSHSAGVSIDVEGKTCIACHRVKPLIDFQKAGKGLRASCRACVAVSLADRSGKDMYHLSMSVDEAWAHAKQCSKCRVVKELRDFAPNKKTKDGVQTRCRACNAVAVVERMPDEPAADGAWTNDVQDNNGHQNGAVAQSFQLPEADNRLTARVIGSRAVISHKQSSPPTSFRQPAGLVTLYGPMRLMSLCVPFGFFAVNRLRSSGPVIRVGSGGDHLCSIISGFLG